MKRRMVCGLVGLVTVLMVFTGCDGNTGETEKSDSLVAGDTAEESDTEANASDTVLRVIEINMGEDKTVTDAMYNEYFENRNAQDGVKEILTNGNFYINGFAIPESEEVLASEWPDGYLLNQSPWLVETDNGYQVDGNDYELYEEAALAAATGFDAGLEVRLVDTNGDDYADRIDMDYVEAVIVDQIIENDDGTFSIRRAEVDPQYTWDNDGTLFDGDHFTESSGEVFSTENFDDSLREGEIGLFWYEPDGWAIERGLEVNGILVDGADHEYYQIGDTKYQDAMRFSRDNIIISNRCGEFTNVQKYFGFMDNDEDLTVSLWFVPTSDSKLWAAPAGFTSGENATVFLEKAIEMAKEKLGSVVVSTDGSDVADGKDWVVQDVYDDLEKAIARAEDVLASKPSSEVLDYQTYLLYFALNGSGDDIGASFAGFDYDGFDNRLNGAVVEKMEPEGEGRVEE